MELSYYGYSNFGWNYQIMVFKFWMELLIMDGDILITHGLEFSLFNYGYENYSVLQQ
jgi:hypothetical protein